MTYHRITMVSYSERIPRWRKAQMGKYWITNPYSLNPNPSFTKAPTLIPGKSLQPSAYLNPSRNFNEVNGR